MKSFIVYPSAFQFWMHTPNSGKKIFCNNFDLCGFNRKALQETAKKYNLSFPLHIALPYNAERKHGKDFVCHTISRRLPANGFIRISEDVYVASPELCFLQAAAVEPIHRLVSIGNDLCGTYYLTNAAKYNQRYRKSITSVEELKDLISCSEHVNGLYNARIAVKYVLNDSYSPYESMIAAVAILPYRYGGFALPRAQLNYNIKLSIEAAKSLRRESCNCDMAWVIESVVLEYDSNLTHLEKDQHDYDKRRANALTASGYTLITAVTEDFKFYSRYEALFDLVRRKLNAKFHKDRMEKFASKRREVFDDLFGRWKYSARPPI